jgi:hypothetical protein
VPSEISEPCLISSTFSARPGVVIDGSDVTVVCVRVDIKVKPDVRVLDCRGIERWECSEEEALRPRDGGIRVAFL